MRIFFPPAGLLALAIPCAALAPETSATLKTEKELARIEAQASSSPTARRLFSAVKRVPRRESRGTEFPDAIGLRGGAAPELVLDAQRLPALSETDAELLLVLNAARASYAFAIPIVEAEQASWQKTLQFAAERGAEDPAGFGARLAKAAAAAAARGDALDRSALPPRSPWEPSETPVLKLPSGALEKTGLLLRLFERDPQMFYWTVERGTPWPPGSARLSELEDLYALRAREIAAMKAPPEGPYTLLGGRRYPTPLALAAYRLRGTGEVERLRESLEAYDSVGQASVRSAVNRWRRAVGK